MRPDKIDIVYLWVDGSDKNWRKEKDKWYKKITGNTPINKDAADEERFRDNGELLYSLRSVAKYVPWVNHIYIVTGFNQIPKWLNTKNKKITIISHKEIMPLDALPTFNSVAIEMCLSNIQGLAEHFLLINDDVFFNKKTPVSYFFDTQGRAKYRYGTTHKLSPSELKRCTTYQSTIYQAQRAISNLSSKNLYKYTPSHGIDPYIKSSIQECLGEPSLRKKFQNQIRNKFRTPDEFQRMIFNLYDFAHGRAKFIHARAKKYGKHKILNTIYNLLHWYSIRQSNVYISNVIGKEKLLKNVATFCINDAPENDINILKQNREFLENRFPNKCEFEK